MLPRLFTYSYNSIAVIVIHEKVCRRVCCRIHVSLAVVGYEIACCYLCSFCVSGVTRKQNDVKAKLILFGVYFKRHSVIIWVDLVYSVIPIYSGFKRMRT